MEGSSAKAGSSLNRRVYAKRQPAWLRYLVAIVAVVIGWAAREALTPGLGPTALPFVFFFPAVALVAWFGGWGPGLLSIALSMLAANWFFIEPVRVFSAKSTFDLVSMLAFAFAALMIVCAMEAMHRARRRVIYAHDLLTTTVASIGDAVVATDAKGNITLLNPEAERLTEWTDAEANGQPLAKVFRIISEITREPAENPVEKVIRTGKVMGLANHTLLVSKNGRETPIDDSAAPIREPNEPLLGAVLVFRDATEQRRAYETKAQLAAIAEHSGDVILTKSLDGIIRTWNAAAERLFGYRAEEIIGKHVTTLFPPDRLHEEDHILGRLRAGQPVERLETIRVAKSGKQIPVFVSVSPMRNPEGELIGASKVVHDITDLVAAREALTREKELLATTLASIGDAVIVTDSDGDITFLNAEAERLTKWKNAEAAGQPLPKVFQIIHEESRTNVENPVEKVLRRGIVVGLGNHTLLIAKDGTETPIDDSAAPIRDPNGTLFGVVLVFRDFTEQKNAQAALVAREQELETVINRTPFMLTRCTRDLRFRFVSRAYAEMIGRKAEDIVGKPIVQVIGENNFNRIRPHIEKVLGGDGVEYEDELYYEHLGKRSLLVVYTPERGDRGEVIGWVGSLLDITERNKAVEALRQAHAQLADRAVQLESLVQQRTTKLQETVGELEAFSYSIAHDMRAPLRAMQGFARILISEFAGQLDADARNYLQRIELSANRMDRLITDILNYSKVVRESLALKPVDAEKLIAEIIASYPALQSEKADITIKSPLPKVLANDAALTQVISNLLGNAVKFVAPGVRPRVFVHGEAVDGFVQLSFEDNGIGIARESQPRLFNIFTRLNRQEAYEGTGIGLAIVRKAVERMGGAVGVDSEEGKGSRFWVRLKKPNNDHGYEPASNPSH